MRVLCHAQHLSGVGHFVRMHALACGLAAAHEVCLVDGGQPVPRAGRSPGLALLALPRLARQAGAVVSLDGDLAETWVERRRRLAAAVAAAPPDVVLIEHYPWSKWELEEEFLALIAAARRAAPGVRIVCSLRDVAPQTRQESADAGAYARRVLDRLAAHFDAVLVHGDPRFTRLEEHFAAAHHLPVPLAYTGFVCVGDAGAGATATGAALGPDVSTHAVLSAGGGARAVPFFLAGIEAFRRLSRRGDLGALRLRVFAGLNMDAAELETLGAAARGSAIDVLPFSTEFPARLRGSALSISQAGYNTCAEILRAGVPAVLVPNVRMSDQSFRAERMRALGLAAVVPGDPPDVDALVEAIGRAHRGPRPRHGLALDGVETTRALLEGLHRDGERWSEATALSAAVPGR